MGKGVETSFADSYHQVLAMARSRLRHERTPMSTGTLAHELFLQMRTGKEKSFESEGQFLAYVGRAIRTLLIDLARERLAQKRHAELVPLTVDSDLCDIAGGTPEQLVAFGQALEHLGRLDPEILQVVDIRAFAGLDVEATANALGISVPTVVRKWSQAKAFLLDALGSAT